MMKTLLACLIISIFFLGCNKPNPNPEQLDEIYSDLTKKADELKRQVEVERANLESSRAELNSVKPQTGQIQYARKRVREAGERLRVIDQMAKYYEIRAESRKQQDQISYLRAWKDKKPWPDPWEYQEFLKAELAVTAKRNWDSRQRMIETGHVPPPKKGGQKEGAKEEKKE